MIPFNFLMKVIDALADIVAITVAIKKLWDMWHDHECDDID